MKLLAIESSGKIASCALLDGDLIIAEYTTGTGFTHSQTLLPMIDEIVKMTKTDLKMLDAVAVSAGPGSFTGLRIGAATAKGICLALDKPLIAVPTLDAMVYSAGPTDRLVVPIMDARRNQVYTTLAGESLAMDMHDLIVKLNAQDKEVLFLGDGVPVYRRQIEAEMTAPYTFAPAHMNRQRAAAVAALAVNLPMMDADLFAPEYLRQSQAEREREEALQAAAREKNADAAETAASAGTCPKNPEDRPAAGLPEAETPERTPAPARKACGK